MSAPAATSAHKTTLCAPALEAPSPGAALAHKAPSPGAAPGGAAKLLMMIRITSCARDTDNLLRQS